VEELNEPALQHADGEEEAGIAASIGLEE